MPRLGRLYRDQLTPAQQGVVDKMLAGPRGGMRGPFESLLVRPELCDRVQHLGAYCRFDTTLERDVAELAIILTGKHWQAQFEFWAHARLAREVGLPEEVIEAVRTGAPIETDNTSYRAVHAFVTEYFATNRVSDATYAQARAALGDEGVVDLVGLVGYYGLVSFTLNVFEVGLPEGEAELLD
jgi:4-carboxymuconolactone decarboxylase